MKLELKLELESELELELKLELKLELEFLACVKGVAGSFGVTPCCQPTLVKFPNLVQVKARQLGMCWWVRKKEGWSMVESSWGQM